MASSGESSGGADTSSSAAGVCGAARCDGAHNRLQEHDNLFDFEPSRLSDFLLNQSLEQSEAKAELREGMFSWRPRPIWVPRISEVSRVRRLCVDVSPILTRSREGAC